MSRERRRGSKGSVKRRREGEEEKFVRVKSPKQGGALEVSVAEVWGEWSAAPEGGEQCDPSRPGESSAPSHGCLVSAGPSHVGDKRHHSSQTQKEKFIEKILRWRLMMRA